VGISGIVEAGDLLKSFCWGDRQQLPADLGEGSLEAGQGWLGDIPPQAIEGLQDDEEGSLDDEPSRPAGIKELSAATKRGPRPGAQHRVVEEQGSVA
jgi:hypothetical protein